MPPKNDPAHRHLKRAPHPQRKSKPKFEIPEETGLPQAPVAWVYRADAVSAPASRVPTTEEPEQYDSDTNSFLAAGMGVFFMGFRTIGFVSLAAFGLIAVPIRVVKEMMDSD
jgi:hypothetical protein